MTKIGRGGSGTGRGIYRTLVGKLRLGPQREDIVTEEMQERINIGEGEIPPTVLETEAPQSSEKKY